ncbi:MAG: ankyrin repeat domain-containing protein [Acidobacteriota bacterium]|nr:ankyrin repeat domain-containing protein [Acidobacteriota bacterium]
MKIISVIIFCTLFALTCTAVSSVQKARPVPRRINKPDKRGYTPLMRAAERGQVNAVRALLKSGAEVDAKHFAGFTAMMLAASKGQLQTVRILLAAGANPNVSVATPHAGTINPLIWGVLSDNKEVVEVLLKAGAEVNPQATDGGTPLLFAVQSGEIEIIKLLLGRGANVNTKMSNGYTALMVAAEISDPEITKVLIAAGADVNARNDFGETALSIAAKMGNGRVVFTLRQARANE